MIKAELIYSTKYLHFAAMNDSKETAELLISHDANISEKDENGVTALHLYNIYILRYFI
ncbi:hypothetical protein TVAG_396150 [Trichomonas vaginalis G3]|uniref:Uncharacterized protein n=1 Tax=Trichomonas vaginalis (strain ATCC PRA-98 / G3) TaxID=412133 RepID=A2ESC6_TRIV3|nr:Ankyrin repeat family [Trichomonas vaginalis G3]EAY04429.1 hypothetical protein TVAG_396150 [Trichomonas vaginalis G3]KAI5502213.1 Ankyrin repeat family [Trichomonas vaginalis G3]|eukprot:XP_001316652.1 hypothetical protein [Trichomonas vaginalis G3]